MNVKGKKVILIDEVSEFLSYTLSQKYSNKAGDFAVSGTQNA